MKPPKDFPISELRTIVLTYKGSKNASRHMMHESQVKAFVEATLKLHYHPGINPYTGGKTSEIELIVSYRLDKSEQTTFWWCSSTLSEDKWNGAYIFHCEFSEMLWAHPDLLAKEAEEDELYGAESE